MAIARPRPRGCRKKSPLTRPIAVTLNEAKSASCDGQAPAGVDAAPGAAYRFESSAFRYRSTARRMISLIGAPVRSLCLSSFACCSCLR